MDYDDSSEDLYWEDDNNDYVNTFSLASYTLTELWEDCLLPTLTDGLSISKYLLLYCLLLRFTVYLGRTSHSVTHMAFVAFGIACLYHFFQEQMVYVLLLTALGLMSVTLLPILNKHRILSVLTSVFFLISCELFIVEKTHWHKIRGCQMVLAMKIISLSYDIEFDNQPSILELLSYFLSPATVIFGPWIKFSDHIKIVEKSPNLNIYAGLKSATLSAAFLTVSTCWTIWIIPDDWNFRWILAYRDALSFRSSHYFISYLSKLTLLIVGYDGLSITSPIHIESPRSLVEVVVYWNRPMHHWLKHYVFRVARPYGNFLAILSTYAASALLHGLNFQLAAVLLSLGFYTYVEYVLRRKLTLIFDACIEARSCKADCKHSNKKGCLVFLTNLLFGLLSVCHLAYLGVMFNSISTIQEEGYSMSHTLSKWSELDFASHWIALSFFIFYLLI